MFHRFLRRVKRTVEDVALMLARRVTPGTSGRPRKPDVDRNGELF